MTMCPESLELVPPHDLDAERGLLAAVLVDSSRLDQMGRILTGCDFHDSANGQLYDALVTLHDAGREIGDAVVLVPELRRLGVTSELWPTAEIGRLIGDGVPSNATLYARQVRRLSLQRQLIDMAGQLMARAHDDVDEPAQIASWATSRMDAIGQSRQTTSRRFGEWLQDVLDDIDASSHTPCRGLMTGIPGIDTTMGAVMPGEVWILAARPGVGKTSLAMQIALHNARMGRQTLFETLEMTGKELSQRTLCGVAGVDHRRVRCGTLTIDDQIRLVETASELHSIPLTIDAPAAATVGAIRGLARLQKRSNGLSLLIVDYLSLIKPDDPKRPLYEQVAGITAALKSTARELEVPVIALCQLNREADERVPTLATLRYSGAIEQDADIVTFLHRMRGSEQVEFILAKHRNGDTGTITLRFNGPATRFEDHSPF